MHQVGVELNVLVSPVPKISGKWRSIEKNDCKGCSPLLDNGDVLYVFSFKSFNSPNPQISATVVI